MVTMTATRQLCGDYGVKHEGEPFQVNEDTAAYLESKGMAERHREPTAPVATWLSKILSAAEPKMQPVAENKMLAVPENKAAEPPLPPAGTVIRTGKPGRPRVVR